MCLWYTWAWSGSAADVVILYIVCVYMPAAILSLSLSLSLSFSPEYKIIIVGLDNAGKTTILYQLWVKVETSAIAFNLHFYMYLLINVYKHTPTC